MFIFNPLYDLSDLTADRIAKESLAILYDSLVVAGMCGRQYDSAVADWGETVNYNVPDAGAANRKITEATAAVMGTVGASGGQVKLDQHLESGYYIPDRDQSRSFTELTTLFFEPNAQALAALVDGVVRGEMYNFMHRVAGSFDDAMAYNTLVDANTLLNRTNVPLKGRRMAVGVGSEGYLLKEDKLTLAQNIDSPDALLNGFVGRGSGFDVHMSQTMPELTPADTRAGAINLGAGYIQGHATAIVVDGFTGVGHIGMWLTIAGVPYQASAVTDTAGDLTGMTLQRPLGEAVADNAVVVIYDLATQGKVDSDAQVATYSGPIKYDSGVVLAPQVGQGCTFGAATDAYGIIAVDTTGSTITLNRPLDANVGATDSINMIPSGSYNWAFNGNSVVLVQRPMVTVGTGTQAGVDMAVAAYEDLAIRVQVWRDPLLSKTGVLLDFLCGVHTIDANRGCLAVSKL